MTPFAQACALPFETLQVALDPARRAVEVAMRPMARPRWTEALLADLRRHLDALHDASRTALAPPVDWYIFSSQSPGAFSLGGDLALFHACALAQDRPRLRAYARDCVWPIFSNLRGPGFPCTTVALLEGDALGGGLECALSFDVVVAERSARIGLFPGMGALHLLPRRVGQPEAWRMIQEGRVLSAEDAHAAGLVDVLAEDGQGRAAVHALLAETGPRARALALRHAARRAAWPVPLEALEEVAALWTDAALALPPKDLRRIERIVALQDRRHGRP